MQFHLDEKQQSPQLFPVHGERLAVIRCSLQAGFIDPLHGGHVIPASTQCLGFPYLKHQFISGGAMNHNGRPDTDTGVILW